MKRWMVLIGVVLVLVLVIGGIKGYSVYKMVQGFKAMGVPKQTVSTIKAEAQDWQTEVAAVGSVRAVRGADLSAEVAGIVDAVQFENGADVKAGQLLVRLRSADDAAELASLKASAEVAETVYKRDQAQLEAQAISQAVLDNDAATLKSAKAQVAKQQALLDKKVIKAPFAGRLGLRAVDEGQYLTAGAKIVTLQTLDPVYVDFQVPQQSLAQLKTGQSVNIVSDTFPDTTFTGEILAIDPKIDSDTRNVQLRARVQNPQRLLLPGMYVNAQVQVGNSNRYVTLPLTAVTYNPYGQTVYVVSHGDSAAPVPADAGKPAATPAATSGTAPAPADVLTAKQIFVTVGAKRGDQVAILKGVEPGDEVITSGQLKLRNGSPIVIDNSVMPTNDPNPKPAER